LLQRGKGRLELGTAHVKFDAVPGTLEVKLNDLLALIHLHTIPIDSAPLLLQSIDRRLH